MGDSHADDVSERQRSFDSEGDRLPEHFMSRCLLRIHAARTVCLVQFVSGLSMDRCGGAKGNSCQVDGVASQVSGTYPLRAATH